MSINVPPPHNVDAEKAVLGAVINDPPVFSRVSNMLTVDDFFIERHGWVWETFVSLMERGIEPDFVTVCSELSTKDKLEQAGGQGYILSLVTAAPGGWNAAGYARLVAETAYRRRLIGLASTTAKLAHSAEVSLIEINDRISRALTNLGGRTVNTYRSAREAFGDFSEDFAMRLQDARDGSPHTGLDTGIPEWNKIFSGDFREGAYIGIMGLTRIGKTWAMMQLARAAAAQRPTIYISLENLEESLKDRFIALEAGIPLTCVRTATYKGRPMPDDMANRIFKASDTLASLPLEFVCHLNNSSEIEHHIKSATIRHGSTGMAFVDTLNQLADSVRRGSERYENLAKASGQLLRTMRSTGWGIVTAIQMRIELKAGMEIKTAKDVSYPTIHAVEGCKKIAQDVSKLIGIYRSDYVAEKTNNAGFYDEQCPRGMALFVDVASRDSEGKTDMLLRWNPAIPRFESAQYDPPDRAATTHAAESIKDEEDLIETEAA